jgi:predicted nucleic acid-binding Zn ribbon protein
VTARLKRPDLDQLGTVIRRWEEIAGPTLSSHAQPVRLGDGVMVVAVDQPAWATQVRALSGALVTRIGEVTGHFPDRLEVVVRRR